MMNNKVYYLSIILLLFIINVFTLSKVHNNRVQNKNYIKVIKEQLTLKNDEIKLFHLNYKTNVKHHNYVLDDITMGDSLNNRVSLTRLIEDCSTPIVVCRFTQSMCSSCVESSVTMMISHADSIGADKIIFMGQGRNHRLFKQFLPLCGLEKMQVYNVSSLPLPIENSNYPYFFMLDKNLKVYNMFIPNKGLVNHTNNYLNDVKKSINNKKHFQSIL